MYVLSLTELCADCARETGVCASCGRSRELGSEDGLCLRPHANCIYWERLCALRRAQLT